MLSLIRLLKEVLAESISSTNLGQDIHLIVESKSEVDRLALSILEHIIKMQMIKDPNYKAGWETTVKKSFTNILKDKWFATQKQNTKKGTLLDPVKRFKQAFESVKEDFNSKLIKNQKPFPKNFSEEERLNILVKYRYCVDKILESDPYPFLDSLNKFLEENK